MEDEIRKEYVAETRNIFWDFLGFIFGKRRTKGRVGESRYLKEIRQELIKLKIEHESLSREFKDIIERGDLSFKNLKLKEISKNEERQDGIKKQIKVQEDKK